MKSSLPRFSSGMSMPDLFKRPSLFVFFVLFLSSITNGQLAPVNPTNNGFYINGKLHADSADVGDWADGTGSGTFVFNSNGSLATGINSAGLISDLYNNTSDLVFSGSAFSDNPNSWKWASSKATSKCDINTGMYFVTTSSTNKWMMIAGDRLTTTGTSYIDFEFYQGILTRVPNNGTFTSTGPNGESLASTGGHTPNDFVLSMEYSNGGGTATVHYYIWELSGGAYKYVEHTVPSNLAYGVTNATSTPAAFTNSAFGAANYIPYAFVEAAVNIDGILQLTNPNCQGINIKTLFIKTKASDSYNAALKDFLEPQEVNFQLGTVDISYSPNTFCKAAGITATPTVSPSGGTFSLENLSGNALTPGSATLNINTSTGVIDVTNSTAGDYVVRYSGPSSGGCSAEDTAHIHIKATPATPSPNNNGPVCAGSALNLSANAVTGATYSWSGPNSFSNSSQNPSIPNATTAASGTYNLSITVNGCTSAQGSTVATVNAQPATPTLRITQQPSLCGDATGSVEVCSPNSNYTYTISLNGGAFGGPQTGSTISFTSLAAGSNPVIKASNGTTGCAATQSCSNAVVTCPNPANATRMRTDAYQTIEQQIVVEESTKVIAYPNPFNNKVKFVVNSSTSGKGSLEVFNMLGQKVKTIYQGNIVSGLQTFELNLPRQNLGTLIYVFRVGEKRITGKLLQMK